MCLFCGLLCADLLFGFCMFTVVWLPNCFVVIVWFVIMFVTFGWVLLRLDDRFVLLFCVCWIAYVFCGLLFVWLCCLGLGVVGLVHGFYSMTSSDVFLGCWLILDLVGVLVV